MENSQIVKVLNMKAAETLTLDKAADRLEFEALPDISRRLCACDDAGMYCRQDLDG